MSRADENSTTKSFSLFYDYFFFSHVQALHCDVRLSRLSFTSIKYPEPRTLSWYKNDLAKWPDVDEGRYTVARGFA